MRCCFVRLLPGFHGFGVRMRLRRVDVMPKAIRSWQASTGTGMATTTRSCLAARDALPHGCAIELPGGVRLPWTAGCCNLQPQPCV